MASFFVKHTDGILRYARGVLKNEHDAQEAVKETFVRAVHGIQSFRGEAKPHYFALTAEHIIIDKVRYGRRKGRDRLVRDVEVEENRYVQHRRTRHGLITGRKPVSGGRWSRNVWADFQTRFGPYLIWTAFDESSEQEVAEELGIPDFWRPPQL